MDAFNLLDGSWIAVMKDDLNSSEEVSLVDVFRNAHKYKRLAGETPAQDFAILRFLLAIMYTVFTRFDSQGNVYEYLELDERMLPKSDIDCDDEEDYLDELNSTWKGLWDTDKFPDIIQKYLTKWKNEFDLFHCDNPFYQVAEENLKNEYGFDDIVTTDLKFRFINRTIAESDSKERLFSPSSEEYKDKLSNSEFARWLISFQGYTGIIDKATLPEKKYTGGKGWLLDIGSVYLKGKNLKETLLLNLVMNLEDEGIIQNQFLEKQTPVWEKSFKDMVGDLLDKKPRNLAELYTNYSRLIVADKNTINHKLIKVIKLPPLDSENLLLEPMTIWKIDKKKDEKKDSYTPRMHDSNQSFWRSFGNVVLSNDENKVPSIMRWHQQIMNNGLIEDRVVNIVSVGIECLTGQGSGGSYIFIDSIYDELNINNKVLTEFGSEDKVGWVIRISEQVELTKKAIDVSVREFVDNIAEIRNINNKKGFVDEIVKAVYFDIDLPFRKWLEDIKISDDKEEKIKKWKNELENIILEHGENLLKNASHRDLLGKKIKTGNKKEGTYMNIAVAHNNFIKKLKNILYEKN